MRSMVTPVRGPRRPAQRREHGHRSPAWSLTKLMTVYVALDAVRTGKLTLDTPLVMSVRAAVRNHADGRRLRRRLSSRALRRLPTEWLWIWRGGRAGLWIWRLWVRLSRRLRRVRLALMAGTAACTTAALMAGTEARTTAVLGTAGAGMVVDGMVGEFTSGKSPNWEPIVI